MRPFFVLITTLATLPALGFGAPPAQDSLAAVLARMDQAAARFKGLTAEMKKVHHEAVINEDDVETGNIIVKRPRPKELKARLNILLPDPKSAVLEGHKAQIYYPKTDEIQPVDLGKESSVVDQFLLLGFGTGSKELESAYTIKVMGPETIAGEQTTGIELIPKDKEVLKNLKKVELWISDTRGITVQQKLYEPGGEYHILTYSNIVINPPIPDSAFDLPKGAHKAMTSHKK